MTESRTPERWLPVVGWEGFYEVSDLGGFRRLYREYEDADGRFIRLRQRRLRGSRRSQYRQTKDYGVQVSSYWIIKMKAGSEPETRYLHVAILEAFVGERPLHHVARHLNDDTDDNRLTNLAWGSHSENMLDLVRNGRHRGVAQTHCPQAHELSGANLIVSKHGFRSCKACAKARSAVRRAARNGEQIDFVGESHRWYALILANPEAGRAKIDENDVREIRRRAANGEKQDAIALRFGIVRAQVSNIVHRKSWRDVA